MWVREAQTSACRRKAEPGTASAASLRAAAILACTVPVSLAAKMSCRNSLDRASLSVTSYHAVPAQFRVRIAPRVCLSGKGVNPPPHCCSIRTVAPFGSPSVDATFALTSLMVASLLTRIHTWASVCMCFTITTTWSSTTVCARCAAPLGALLRAVEDEAPPLEGEGATLWAPCADGASPARHVNRRDPFSKRPSPLTRTRSSPSPECVFR
mmetsp:Transcript_15572/g.27657  ORF Transcript_15572/g.27657 Transcript_15572/m.27657 type:complete len:211 (+) Transcript_15572:308-940(+)